MTQVTRLGATLGLAAAAAMAASPAAAADLPSIVNPSPNADYVFGAFDGDAANAEHHRYRRYHRYHRRNRIDAGDVIAGVLVLGGIAAIASAASSNNRNDRNRNYDRRYEDRRYDDRRDYDRRGDSRSTGSRGLDNAVSQCVTRIERDVRVDTVNSVDRNGEGWIVTGSLYNGEGFSCRIGNDGQIDRVDYAGGYSGADASRSDNQWSDEDYYRARQAMRGPQSEPQPAYPGGPLPDDEEIDADLGG